MQDVRFNSDGTIMDEYGPDTDDEDNIPYNETAPKARCIWKNGYYICGTCRRLIRREDNYCSFCGWKIDWEA